MQNLSRKGRGRHRGRDPIPEGSAGMGVINDVANSIRSGGAVAGAHHAGHGAQNAAGGVRNNRSAVQDPGTRGHPSGHQLGQQMVVGGPGEGGRGRGRGRGRGAANAGQNAAQGAGSVKKNRLKRTS